MFAEDYKISSRLNEDTSRHWELTSEQSSGCVSRRFLGADCFRFLDSLILGIDIVDVLRPLINPASLDESC
jgi:hypothetical protein